jgi:hypothetical protein
MFHRVASKASVIVAALLAVAVPVTRAQENCQSFRAILPMTLDINTGYSGTVYAVMGTEVLIGKSLPGVPPQTSCDAVSCRDTAARGRFDFGGSGLMNPGDTLTIEVQTAQYSLPGGYGTYNSMWKIVEGTGRFAQASGILFEWGPYVAWVDDKNIPQSTYIGEIEGTVCGAKPQKNASAQSSAKPLTSIPASAFQFYQRQLSPSVRK